jgi:hypothetical protein
VPALRFADHERGMFRRDDTTGDHKPIGAAHLLQYLQKAIAMAGA